MAEETTTIPVNVTITTETPVVAATATAEAPAAAPAPPVPPALALWLEVAGASTTKGTAVRELVIAELTHHEILKRKDAVLVLLARYDDKTKELKKAEAAGTWDLNVNGDKVGDPKYSKEQVGVIKGLRDDIAKVSAALTAFFDNNDTKKLYELGLVKAQAPDAQKK